MIVDEFQLLLDDEECTAAIASYSSEERLDDFYFRLIAKKEKYKALWVLVRKVLVLSHGNASVSSNDTLNIC